MLKLLLVEGAYVLKSAQLWIDGRGLVIIWKDILRTVNEFHPHLAGFCAFLKLIVLSLKGRGKR
jgi:hypothetical protein